MISNKDRSFYIGASDISFVVGSWTTKTFDKWFMTKAGLYKMDFSNDAMKAGSAYEHRILESLNIQGLEMDKQVISGRLRVNLDGNTSNTIYEIKTYKFENGFKVPKKYKQQVCVQMYATGIKNAYIVAYGLVEDDYKNFYRSIDKTRLSIHEVTYDSDFIDNVFLPKYAYIANCLDKGIFPKEEWKSV